MTVVTLAQEAARPERGSFRVPRFEVSIEGASLSHDVLRDVVSVTYRDSVAELDGFELSVSNWDSDRRRFKYTGAETAADLEGSGPDSELAKLFEPCNKHVEVRLGYVNALQLMLTGSVTTLEPKFPSGGEPTLTVRGLNVLHELRRKQYTWAWENKRDSEIAQNLATLRDPDTGNQRFPLPIEVDRAALSAEDPIEYVAQQNQYDIDFLAMRARERGYVVFVQEEDERAGRPRRLWFGPSHGGQASTLHPVIFELEWGKGLIEFTPTLSTAHQVKSVTVNGWNRQTREQISATVSLDDEELNRNQDLHRVLRSCDPREEIVVSEPVFTPGEAERRARDILENRLGSMVTAEASCVGLPDLRAGGLVHIVGLGARFSGIYFVTEATHTIDASGYMTKFKARREAALPNPEGGA